MQKAEEYREQFEKSFNLKEQIKKENDEQAKKYMLFREKLHIMDSHKNYDENILYFDYLKLWIEKVKNNLELTTYTSHLQMINSRIKNYFTLNPIKLLELEPIHIQNFYDILLADGLKPTTVIRFHNLRHSCASLLLARNVPMKAIQEWLGHSDFSTTANVCAHLDINSKLLSAEAISSAFRKKINKSSF